MVENPNRKLLLGIVAVAGLLIMMFAASFALRIYAAEAEGVVCGEGCPHEAQAVFLAELIPLLVGIGVIVGAGTFYFTGQKVVAKEKLLKSNTEILLRFLSREERQVVNRLIENHGRALQAEITRLPGMSKVKSHRIIKRLIERGVLEKEDFGKTKVVKFTKEVQEGVF